MEVSVIKNTGGLGRIDLMRISSGECWEVKPYYAFAAGSRQLEGYVRGKLLNITSNIPLRRGGYIIPKTIEYEGYTVNYWYAGSGIILYTYTPSKKSLASAPAPKKQPKTNPVTEPLIGYRPEEEYDPSPAETGIVIIGIVLFAAAVLLAPATGGLSLAFAW